MTTHHRSLPALRARAVLLHILGDEARDPGTDAYHKLMLGMTYVNATDPSSLDTTLAIAGVEAVARSVLREGHDLTTAGKALGPYATDIQARAWAAAKLESALAMLVWHPQRIARERYAEQCGEYFEDQRVLKAARKAVPMH